MKAGAVEQWLRGHLDFVTQSTCQRPDCHELPAALPWH